MALLNLPRTGDVIILDNECGYARAGEQYTVRRLGREFRLESVDRGSATYCAAWEIDRAGWTAIEPSEAIDLGALGLAPARRMPAFA